MKKFLSVFLIAVMLLCMNIGVFAKVDSFVVDFDIQAPSSVAKNEEFTVSVGVDMLKDHALSGTIQIGFDTSKIEYASATAIGDNIETDDDFDLSSYFGSVINDTQSGKVIVSFFSYNECPEDYVKIVEIKFRAKSTGTTAFYVYTDDWWDEYNGVEYWDSDTDGKPKTDNAVHTISITDKAPEPEVVLGDVNGDGKITAADARLTLRASARIETLSAAAEKNADVNNDGKVNASDARMILRVSAKIDSFDNPVTPVPPVTGPDIKLKADTSVRYLKKGGTAVVFVEVVGKLGSNGVGISGDGSSFKVEFGENLLTSKETGNKIVVLFVSALKNTSTQNIKVYIKGYENSIYVNIPINVSSSGSNDYCGVAGAVDYGAYTGVAPMLYNINEDASSYGFYYSLDDLFDADLSAEQILTNFFNYLKRLGYKQTSYKEFDDMVSYMFTNSSKTVTYTYSVIYDKYGSPSAIMIVCFLK